MVRVWYYLRLASRNFPYKFELQLHAAQPSSPGLDICFEAILFSKGLHDLKGLFKVPSATQELAENAEGVVGRNHLTARLLVSC